MKKISVKLTRKYHDVAVDDPFREEKKDYSLRVSFFVKPNSKKNSKFNLFYFDKMKKFPSN